MCRTEKAVSILAILLSSSLLANTSRAQWPTPERAVCTTTANQSALHVMPSTAGGVFVQWAVSNNGYSFFAQNIDAAGVDQWATNGVYLDAFNGSFGNDLTRTVPAGTDGFAWGFISGGDVWVNHVGSAGLPDWTHPSYGVGFPVPLGIAQFYPSKVRVASDGAGGIFVAWIGVATGASASQIFMQRVDAAGAPLWTAGGVLVAAPTTPTLGPADPSLASDGNGGVFVGWHEDIGRRILVQHLDANGSPVWGPQGVSMPVDALYAHLNTRVVSDLNGGAYVLHTRSPYGNGFSSEVVQRVDASGSAVWSRILLNGAQTGQRDVVTLPSGDLVGVIEHFPDHLTLGEGLYAFRLDRAGNYAWGSDVSSASFIVEPGSQLDPRMALAVDGTIWVTWKDAPALFVYPAILYRAFDPSVAPGSAPGDTLDGNSCSEHDLVALSSGEVVATYADRRNGNWDVYATQFASLPTSTTPLPDRGFGLDANWPNPFTGATSISFSLNKTAAVELTVYDLRGRRIRTLERGSKSAGRHVVRWDGRNDTGQAVTGGVYFVRMRSGDHVLTRRMTLRH